MDYFLDKSEEYETRRDENHRDEEDRRSERSVHSVHSVHSNRSRNSVKRSRSRSRDSVHSVHSVHSTKPSSSGKAMIYTTKEEDKVVNNYSDSRDNHDNPDPNSEFNITRPKVRQRKSKKALITFTKESDGTMQNFVSTDSDQRLGNEESVECYDINEFDITSTPTSASNFLCSRPRSGKNYAMINFAYYNAYRYPVARVISGNPIAAKEFSRIFPPLFVSDSYTEEAHRDMINRQRLCLSENYQNYEGNNLLSIFDDISDSKTKKDTSIFGSTYFQNQFKVQTQHSKSAFYLATQNLAGVFEHIKTCSTYVYIFKHQDLKDRKKLFEYFGGSFRNFNLFCSFMDKFTDNYQIIVLNRQTPSNELKDTVFVYRPEDIKNFGDWKFGAKEIWQWSEKRYDKNKDNFQTLLK